MKQLSLIVVLAGVLAAAVGCDAPAPAPTPSLYPTPTPDTHYTLIEDVEIKDYTACDPDVYELYPQRLQTGLECRECNRTTHTLSYSIGVYFNKDNLAIDIESPRIFYAWVESNPGGTVSMTKCNNAYDYAKSQVGLAQWLKEEGDYTYFTSFELYFLQEDVAKGYEPTFSIKMYDSTTGEYLVTAPYKVTFEKIENNFYSVKFEKQTSIK